MLAIWSLVPLPFIDPPCGFVDFCYGLLCFLCIWKFAIHVLLKPCLENFGHYSVSLLDLCSCMAVWSFLALPFFGIEMKTELFQSCGHGWVFQTCWHIDWDTLIALPFRTWNSLTGIPSPPLPLFVMMLPKAHLNSYSRMSGSRWATMPLWLSGSWRSFLYIFVCILSIS